MTLFRRERKGLHQMGDYPTPPRVVELLRDLLIFPESPFTALDPCCGTGEALAALLRATQARTYGVEIHVGRYELARGVLHRAALGAAESSKRPPLPPHMGHHALLLAGGAMNGRSAPAPTPTS